jgi:membrane protease YdiL (CAAX protease family)
LLAGTFAFHGLAEELVWRGYVYRRLRETRPFWRAVVLTMPFVAVAHIPIIVSSGWLVGAAALMVAAVTSAPLARLYDLGRGTLWAPAILHAAIDTFKLVTVPAADAGRFSLLLSGFSVLVPLLVLAVPDHALRPLITATADE